MKIIKACGNEDVADLILSASSCAFDDCGEKNKKEICQFLFESKNNLYSYENSFLLVLNNEIIGILIGYDSNLETMLSYEVRRLVKDKFNIKIENETTESLEDTFYIDTIAIKKGFSNKGYGSNLLVSILELKKDVSLLVDVDNKNAIYLYKKLGFVIIEEIHIYNHMFYKCRFDLV